METDEAVRGPAEAERGPTSRFDPDRIERALASCEAAATQRQATFTRDFARRLADATDAETAVLWVAAAGGGFESASVHGRPIESPLPDDVLRRAAASKGPTRHEPAAAVPGDGDEDRGRGREAVLVPVPATAVPHVLEVRLAGGSTARDVSWVAEVASSFAELLGTHLDREAVTALRSEAAALEDGRRLACAAAAARSTREALELVAREAPRLLDCDRVTIVIDRHARRWATSVPKPDRGVTVLKTLRRIGAASVRAGAGCLYPAAEDAPAGIDPKFVGPLNRYDSGEFPGRLRAVPVDAAGGTAIAAGDRAVACLVAERFGDGGPPPADPDDRPTRLLAECVAAVVGRAGRTGRGPLGAVGKTLSRLLPVAFLAGVGFAAWAVPAEHRLVVTGRLTPVERADVFAPRDALITGVRADGGTAVAAGDVVLTMRDGDLEAEIERVDGELRAAREKRVALQIRRGSAANGDDATERARISAEAKEVETRIAGLGGQLAILVGERDRLTLESPIDGKVVTWDVDTLLRDRPVRRGQRLLTVVADEAAWELTLVVPDRQAGHVESTFDRDGTVPVRFVAAGGPDRPIETAITSLSESSEAVKLGAAEEIGLLATATLEARPDGVRPGETVVATLSCGEVPLGYALLYELIDWTRARAAVLGDLLRLRPEGRPE